MKKVILGILFFSLIWMGEPGQHEAKKQITKPPIKKKGLTIKSPTKKMTDVELGIQSISPNSDGTVNINIYMINKIDVYGYQMEIRPIDRVKVSKIFGGLSEKIGFNMTNGKTGTLLGFSFQGKSIPRSQSQEAKDNIIFTVTAEIMSGKNKELELTLTPIIAGKGGSKLEVNVIPYKYTTKK